MLGTNTLTKNRTVQKRKPKTLTELLSKKCFYKTITFPIIMVIDAFIPLLLLLLFHAVVVGGLVGFTRSICNTVYTQIGVQNRLLNG